MAYAAAISLKQTIQRLLNSSHFSVVFSSQVLLKFVYNEVGSLQRALEGLNSSSSSSSSKKKKRLDALDGEIREAVHKIEDLLEFHQTDEYFSQSAESYGGDEGSNSNIIVSLDLGELREEITSIAGTMKKMGEDYIQELDNPSSPEDEDDDAAGSSSYIDFGVEMVGLDGTFALIKKQLLQSKMRPDDFGVFSFVGEAGTGRTIAAKTILEDLYLHQEQSFDCCAWMTIGPNYQVKEILLSILAQLGNNDQLLISQGDDETNIGDCVYERLKGRRYIIVLDDVWDTQLWGYLSSSFPQQDNNGSLVLLTTSLAQVAESANSFYTYRYNATGEEQMEGWLRLALCDTREEYSSPPELDEAGKKIAKNCKDRMISVYKVLLFLRKTKTTPECWNELAADKENPIFKVEDEIAEIFKINEEMQLYLNDDVITDIKGSLTSFTSTEVEIMKNCMFPERFLRKMKIISLVGMIGIGKTTIVKKAYEDLSISSHFDHRAWVTVGPKYKSEDILVDILAQIYPNYDKMDMKRSVRLVKKLCKQLSYKRCLIVLDDVWYQEPLHYLKNLCPNIRGKALVTTRIEMQFGKGDIVRHMRLLNEDESWRLFCQKVFDKELCPLNLEEAGKKIVHYCEGLPLMILTVADLLFKAEKTTEYWNEVAEEKNSVFTDAHDQITKVLLPSYEYLPQHLRVCFLYMGIFPRTYDITLTQFIMLCTVEGFLEPHSNQSIEEFVANCLYELTLESLVITKKKVCNYGSKSFHLHSIFWHLSNSIAMKKKFFHAWNRYAGNSIEDVKGHRRLCVRKSILLGMKDVHDLMSSISTARSLLCNGPAHQYPVPICFGLRLLRVVDAFVIRFYHFPIEVLKLIHLRYLAITCNGKLPTSISKLWNLQHLAIGQHLHIRSSSNSSSLPVSIWDMKELRHLQVMGGRLPNPNGNATLPDLKTLLDVSVDSCTEKVLKGLPNLKRLGVRIELAPDGDDKTFYFLNNISSLKGLSELKCIVVNHQCRSNIVAPSAPVLRFSSDLVRLSLSGLEYPWECMSIIAQLNNLEVLKLRCYAFRGPKWEIDCFSFSKLKFLSIEDTDLMHWNVKLPSFGELECLSLKHCYKLEELPTFRFSKTIEVVDCSPSTLTWVSQIKETYGLVEAHVHCSWNAGNLKQ